MVVCILLGTVKRYCLSAAISILENIEYYYVLASEFAELFNIAKDESESKMAIFAQFAVELHRKGINFVVHPNEGQMRKQTLPYTFLRYRCFQ